MVFRILAIAAGALLAMGCASVAPPRGAALQLVDLTDDFARIHDRDAALPDADRVARFRASFAEILPGFYDAARVGMPPQQYDAFLLKALRDFPGDRAGIERVAREFAAMLAPAQASFEAAFGPLAANQPVYLVHSLGEFDGGTRDLPEGSRLMFGADMIARLYRTTPIRPFFHHELFHLHHGPKFGECHPVWCALWSEGLAVHVAATLNPGASDASLLLTVPEPLREAVEKNRARAVCAVSTRLQSTKGEDYKALFSNGRIDPALPGRFGYYVGYLVARDLGRTRTLRELAALSPEQALPLIEQALARLARCG
jgi:hypothetical protein